MINAFLALIALGGIFIASGEAEDIRIQMAATLGGGGLGVLALIILAVRGD